MKFDNENGNNRPIEAKIVRTATMVTLLGAGELDFAELDAALRRAPGLVAADGGAGTALALGRMPDAVIGDFDSLSEGDIGRISADRLHRLADQNSTDFDKAVRAIDAPGIIAVGFTGERIDHELAAYHTLAAYRDTPCILLGRRDIVFAAPPHLQIKLEAGARVSLFPMAQVTGRSTGLRWPINGLEFAPDRRIGTSNEMKGTELVLEFDQPGMLVILPKRFLDAVIQALVEFPLPSAAPSV